MTEPSPAPRPSFTIGDVPVYGDLVLAPMAEVSDVRNLLRPLRDVHKKYLALSPPLLVVFVKRKGNHLITEKGTTSDVGPAP